MISGVESAQSDLAAALKHTDELLENPASNSILAPRLEGESAPTLAEIQIRLELWASSLDALQWMTEFNRIGKSLTELGLHTVLKRGADWESREISSGGSTSRGSRASISGPRESALP